ncbi:ABC transporter permease [Roseivirga misakiensis]|uniref:Uncharacterized protein n=1 Tax=Roseivirga misakiensis TaxID=1563681 RepID=A0A1E5T0R1_9BACT|nr:ABC transporter permease [Roseivirga misakiensis]OEK04972.1 hypothetical protein BFP71_16210 [Roseivirga misakiensis]
MSTNTQDNRPPWLIMKIFRWFCSQELQRFVEGDLIELYRERIAKRGKGYANWRFLIDVVTLFRPSIIGFTKGLYINNNIGMVRNYLKVGARNLWKDRFYTGINLFGISVGLAFSFLVLLLVNYEFSFEDFRKDKHLVKRLGIHNNIGGKEDTYVNVPRPLAPTLLQEFPEVQYFTRAAGLNGMETHKGSFEYNNMIYTSGDAFIVDSTFFKVFDTKLVSGDIDNVLNRPSTAAISQSFAEMIFGKSDPIGQTLESLDGGNKFEITGVFEDVPSNTHLPFEVLLSWNGYFDEEVNTRWYGAHTYSYVKLKEAYQAQNLIEKFPDLFDAHMKETYDRINGSADLIVQNIEDIHLKSHLTWEANKNGDEVSVYVLLAIGIFLILIALVNYLNLSLARNSLRRKEISVRKVIGASRFNISGQFLIETLLFTALAFMFSLLIVKLVYSEFRAVAGVDLLPFAIENLLLFAVAALSLGLLISIYPSIILSGIRLVEGLKGRHRSTKESGRLQQGLVVLQFTISTIVILFTFVVKNQLDYLSNVDLGFEKDNVIVFQLEDSVLSANSEFIKERVKVVAGVRDASFASDRPGLNLNHTILNVEDNGTYNAVGSQFMRVDHDFAQTIGLQILEGRSFIKGSDEDARFAFMINESAKAKFGWGDDAVGKKMYFQSDEEGNPIYMTLIGVFKDFNIGSLHSAIQPISVFYNKDFGEHLMVRLSGGDHRMAVTQIEEVINDLSPKLPVSYDYLSVQLERQYSDENRLSKAMAYLSVLTIVISILGFIGLLSFAISKREAEVGVRKVLGASVTSVVVLFYKQILILILVAEVIAIPVNQVISNQWLNGFEYRVFPSLLETGLILIGIIVLSLGIMGFQVLKVAFMNPVDVIKEE